MDNEEKNNVIEFPQQNKEEKKVEATTSEEIKENKNTHIYTREEMVQQIKDCGESIVKNADAILGNEQYFLALTVMFEIKRDRSQLPSIMIQRQFLPEHQIEVIKNKEQ